jgi:hypothetical protein
MQTLTKNDIHESEPTDRKMTRSLSQKSLNASETRRLSYQRALSERIGVPEKDHDDDRDMMISQNNSGETALSSDVEEQADLDLEQAAPPPSPPSLVVDDAAGTASSKEDNHNNNDKDEDNGDNEKEDLVVENFSFEDTNGTIYVPMAGVEQNDDSKTSTTTTTTTTTTRRRRQAPNGCAICLNGFDPDEKITWSYNPQCSHIFHHDCVLHWFLTVGRKEQRNRRRRLNSQLLLTAANASTAASQQQAEELAMICKFPMVCPCCRQSFCKPVEEERKSTSTSSSITTTDSSGTNVLEAVPTTVEPASAAVMDEQPQPQEETGISPQSTPPPVDAATIDRI